MTKSIPTLLRHADVRAMTGLSRSGLYRMLGQKSFPKPIKVSDRAVRFHRSEVESWLAGRPRAADYSEAN